MQPATNQEDSAATLESSRPALPTALAVSILVLHRGEFHQGRGCRLESARRAHAQDQVPPLVPGRDLSVAASCCLPQ